MSFEDLFDADGRRVRDGRVRLLFILTGKHKPKTTGGHKGQSDCRVAVSPLSPFWSFLPKHSATVLGKASKSVAQTACRRLYDLNAIIWWPMFFLLKTLIRRRPVTTGYVRPSKV